MIHNNNTGQRQISNRNSGERSEEYLNADFKYVFALFLAGHIFEIYIFL